MIAKRATYVVVLKLTYALFAQLCPFLADLDIAIPHDTRACSTLDALGQFVPDAKVQHAAQQLTMGSDVYDALIKRVGSALDYSACRHLPAPQQT